MASAAQDPERVTSITLEEAIQRFHRNSPELLLARIRLRHDLAASRQGRATPNPTVSFTSEDLGEYSERYLNLTQRMDFLWTGGSRGRRAEAQEIGARARLRADSTRLGLEVRKAYVQAWGDAERVEALRDADAIVRDLLHAANARFAAGDLAGYDVRRLSVERVQVSHRLTQAELELRHSQLRLGALVAGKGIEPLGAKAELGNAPTVPFDFDAVGAAMVGRSEIVAGGATMDDRDATAALARASRLSGASLTGGLKTQSDGRSGLFLGVQLPLPLLDRRSAAVEAANANVDRAALQMELIRRTVSRQALLALTRLEAAQRMLGLIGEGGVGEGDRLLVIARISYDEGELGIVGVLDAAETYLEAQFMKTAIRAESWLAFFELDRAVGGLPAGIATGDER